MLICSPTGSGKTLSAFISIINQLFVHAKKGELENSVYCLYISPLKSLANDIHKNLERPLQEMQALAEERGLEVQEIRHAIRHGDVSAQEKARMLKRTPHILNTTPESLAILLSSPRFPAEAQDGALGDRGRDPFAGRVQARRAPLPQPGAAGGAEKRAAGER